MLEMPDSYSHKKNKKKKKQQKNTNSKSTNIMAIQTNLMAIKELLPINIVFISAYILCLWNRCESWTS